MLHTSALYLKTHIITCQLNLVRLLGNKKNCNGAIPSMTTTLLSLHYLQICLCKNKMGNNLFKK